MASSEFEGKVIAFCAPSGSGKTTIVKHLLNKYSNLGFSISACTRDKRGRSEESGKDYYFLSIEEFKDKIQQNEFVEWEEVYEGSYYGTLWSEIHRNWEDGKHVVFDVDVKGGLNLKKVFKQKALIVYVKVPSIEELENRLRARGTESEESISRRLYRIKFEMQFEDQFDAVLVNENLEETLKEAEEIINGFIY